MLWHEALIEDLKRDEGFRQFPYKCPSDKLTIGIGRNIEDNGITEEEAEYLCHNDVGRCVAEAREIFPAFPILPDNVKRAVINMLFQLGRTRFTGFKKMIAALRERDYERAAVEALDSRWAKQTPRRAERVASLIRKGAAS